MGDGDGELLGGFEGWFIRVTFFGPFYIPPRLS